MFSICAGLEILPASRYAGSPPTKLNRKNTSSTTPSSVGANCHRRRTTYASKASVPGSWREIEIHPLGVQHRVLGEPDDVRLLQRVADAAVGEQPHRVHFHSARHLVV